MVKEVCEDGGDSAGEGVREGCDEDGIGGKVGDVGSGENGDKVE